MNESILNNKIPMRLATFARVFAAVAGWERLSPRRRLSQPKAPRWADNTGPVALNTLMLRLLFPLAAAGTAASASTHGWDLFNALTVWRCSTTPASTCRTTSTGCCAWWWSPPTGIASTTRSTMTRPTQTSGSICRRGAVCSAPIATGHAPPSRA